MPANNALTITSTNFDEIVGGLRQFLAANPDFQDYDFEGSALATITDLLGYNTYFESILLFQVANESTLDTAQLRNSVVSRSKMMNYMPTGAQGATATIQIAFEPMDDAIIEIPKNTIFTSSINGIDYTFVNVKPYFANTDNDFTVEMDIQESIPLEHRFTVDTNSNQRYILPNINIDTNNISVYVQNVKYEKAQHITDINKNSLIYFFQENYDNQYEIYFGDGVLGKPVENGDVILIEYYVNHGIEGNGASVFTPPATISGINTFTVSTISSAKNGVDIETLESIKFNAPKTYTTQNRAVIAEDYRQMIRERFPFLTSVRVWGGEENEPPRYGQVGIATYPNLTLSQRRDLTNYLTSKNIVTAIPFFLDPTFLFITPNIVVKYNPDNPVLESDDLLTRISNAVLNYEQIVLNTFNNTFYKSQLSEAISRVDTSIISVNIDIQLQKKFNPAIGRKSTYNLSFHNPFNFIENSNLSLISSNQFSDRKNQNLQLDDDNQGNIRTFNINPDNNKIYHNLSAGEIDYSQGNLTLNQFEIIGLNDATLNIKATPKHDDITSAQNQLLLFSLPTIQLIESNRNRVVGIATLTNTIGDNVEILETGIN